MWHIVAAGLRGLAATSCHIDLATRAARLGCTEFLLRYVMLISPKIIWLLRLRWAAFCVQAFLLVGAHTLIELQLDYLSLASVLAVMALTNLALHVANRRNVQLTDTWIGLVLGLDIALLTIGLGFSGGPMNPFSFLYVVYVAVAAVMTSWRLSVGLTVLAIGGYGILYMVSIPAHHDHHMAMHLHGMWVAMAVSAGLIIFFVSMLQRALTERDRELSRMRSNHEKLASLTAMAAGAAHELATPLGTIALASKDLAEMLKREGSSQMAEDAVLIRDQVQRCRAVIERMAVNAGQHTGQAFSQVRVSTVVEHAIEALEEAHRVEVVLPDETPMLNVPEEALQDVLRSLLRNGLDASGDDQSVRLSIKLSPSHVMFCVADRGPGIPEARLDRLTEPFFTTKDSRDRLGLGLYVANQLARSLGGTLEFSRESGETRVVFSVPR